MCLKIRYFQNNKLMLQKNNILRISKLYNPLYLRLINSNLFAYFYTFFKQLFFIYQIVLSVLVFFLPEYFSISKLWHDEIYFYWPFSVGSGDVRVTTGSVCVGFPVRSFLVFTAELADTPEAPLTIRLWNNKTGII